MADDQFKKMVDVVSIFRKIPMDKLVSEGFNKIFRGLRITLIKMRWRILQK